MSSIPRKEQVFKDIVRLRRAEQAAPELREIATVRSHLERELGGSVSRSLAARLLGVSHTALQKWIDAGDVPVVITPSGRKAVPVAALVDLYEAVRSARTTGERRLHVMEPNMAAARARADALKADKLLAGSASPRDPHDRGERRNRAYHAALARRLRRDAVDRALHQLWRWEEEGNIDTRYAAEWERVLRLPIADIKRVLTDDSPHARDLRQNSPFAGALSEPERRKILEEIL
ncbi:MAG TPA: hypothetical protein VF549_16710 [Solirubrobacteraceae bacterium]